MPGPGSRSLRVRGARGPVLAAIAAVVVAVAVAGCRRRPPGAGTEGGSTPGAAARVVDAGARVPEVIDQLPPVPPASFEGVVEAVRPSLVNIQSSTKVRGGPASMYPGASLDSSLGTGFIVDRPGYVLTNFHIVRRAPELHVVLADGASLPASLLAWDERLDIALLRITDPPELPPVRLADGDAVVVGRWVIALGAPFPRSVSANPGVISALPRLDYSPMQGAPPHNYGAFVQTDAAIHEGNTGGPLVDLDGAVVGLSVIGAGTGAGAARIGFAVPIDRIRAVLPQLQEGGAVARSWLGVRVLPVTHDMAEQTGYEGTNGAFVSEVQPGGPAARAGLRRGDIIVAYGGQEVTDRNLALLIELTPPGRRVTVAVWRDRARTTVDVVPARMPQ